MLEAAAAWWQRRQRQRGGSSAAATAAAAGQRSKDASGDGLEGQMGGGAGKGRGVAVLTWDVEFLVEFCELSAGVSTQYALVYIRVTHSRWVM